MPEIPVSPVEDLMREHGVIHRLLLLYENIGARIMGNHSNRPVRIEAVLLETASLFRRFAEEYHQTLEEENIFPIILQRGKDVKLAQVLLKQHHAARCVTDRILQAAREINLTHAKNRQALDGLLKQYIRLYIPHAAWEDTEIFPAFRGMLNEVQWCQMGSQFEAAEERRFGRDGFSAIIRQVELLEKALSVNDLNRYTPEC